MSLRRYLPAAATIFVRALHKTLRLRHVESRNLEEQPQYIQTFWHEHLALMLHSRFRFPIMVMSSRSKDGDLSAGVFERYGVECARGSSSRGGSSALREMIRRARNGRNIVFTPDGPKGPRRVAKDGVIFAAQATGLPIVPVAFAAKKKSVLAPGIRWSSPGPSPARSLSTAFQSSFLGMATWKNGGLVSNWRSTSSLSVPRLSSTSSGPLETDGRAALTALKGIS